MKLYCIPVDTTVTIQNVNMWSSYVLDAERYFQENDIDAFDDECVSFRIPGGTSIWSARWKDVRVIIN